MDCRFCDEPMEREDCYQTSGTRGIVQPGRDVCV